MKIDFTPLADGKVHSYCISCHADDTKIVKQGDQAFFSCPTCGEVSDRNIYLGNGVGSNWWIDDKDGELWHESAGVFIREPSGKYLFFERTDFPRGYTIPAGHVDFNEDHRTAAARETQEEVGVQASALVHIVDADIASDSCNSGADVHRWHIYREDLPEKVDVSVLEEGRSPAWLTLEEILDKDLPPAIRFIIERYADEINTKPA